MGQNIKDKIEKIKTPQDVFNFMNENIEYGWLDTNGKYTSNYEGI